MRRLYDTYCIVKKIYSNIEKVWQRSRQRKTREKTGNHVLVTMYEPTCARCKQCISSLL